MLSKNALEIVNGVRSGDAIGGPSKMATIVAESIAVHHQVVPEDLIRRYYDWWNADAFDTGPTFALVFGNVKSGMDHAAAVHKAHEDLGGQSSGCAPAQRIGSLAACDAIPNARLSEQARLEASLTHFDADAGAASAVVAIVTRLLMRCCDQEEVDAYMEQHEREAWSLVAQTSIGNGGTGYEAVHLAWDCLWSEQPSMQLCERISSANNYAGPILGAFLASQRLREMA